jgi:hypothetical protein
VAKKKKTEAGRVMREFKEGTLRSGSPDGPVVKKRSQAKAIAANCGKSLKVKLVVYPKGG